MKKLWILLLTLIMIVTGCQTNSGEDGNAKSKELENIKGVEVEFWHALGGALGDGLTEIIESYNASQDRFIIKPVVLGSYTEIDEKLQAAYASKTTPALVVGGSQNTFYQKGLVEVFEDFMPEAYDKEDLVGGFLKAASVDDKLVFAPAYGTSQVLYYNKAVLEQQGFTEEDLGSWQSLVAMSSKIIGTETGTNKIEYIWEPMWGSGNIADIVASAGGTFVSDDAKTVTINSDEWVEVLEQVRGWIHDEKNMRIHSGGQGWEYWYKTMDDWVYGTSLGYTGSPGDYAIALEAVNNATAEGVVNEFAVVHQPGWNEADPAPYFSSHMYFIPKSDQLTLAQKVGAAEFVAYATNTDNTAKFSMATGYVAVRNSVLDLELYKTYLESNPDADAALIQIDKYAIPNFIDPTGGAIYTALGEAVDKVQIENVSAKEALDEAAQKAQKELDKVNQ